MTNDLPALRKRLAEGVMGWKLLDRLAMGWGDGPEVWSTGENPNDEDSSPTFQDWSPDTDIADAMRVAEKVGEGWMLVKDRNGLGYFCTFSSQGLMGCGVVATPALAICLAADAWLMEKQKQS